MNRKQFKRKIKQRKFSNGIKGMGYRQQTETVYTYKCNYGYIAVCTKCNQWNTDIKSFIEEHKDCRKESEEK